MAGHYWDKVHEGEAGSYQASFLCNSCEFTDAYWKEIYNNKLTPDIYASGQLLMKLSWMKTSWMLG